MPTDTIRNEIMATIDSMAGTKDVTVIDRLMQTLELCAVNPLSCDELAEHFGIHYQTMYRDVKMLKALGVLHVTAKKNRKHLYSTTWNLVKQDADSEFRLRNSQGDWKPVSQFLEFLLTRGRKEAGVALADFAGALISRRENERLRSRDEANYGTTHSDACLRLMREDIAWLKNVLFIMEQALESPIVTSNEGWEMYKLPVDVVGEAEANQWHDSMEAKFHELGWYEGK